MQNYTNVINEFHVKLMRLNHNVSLKLATHVYLFCYNECDEYTQIFF